MRLQLQNSKQRETRNWKKVKPGNFSNLWTGIKENTKREEIDKEEGRKVRGSNTWEL